MIDAGDDDAYLFDVVRAHGGKNRTYWFHGNQTTNVDADAVAASATPENVIANDGEDLDDLGGLDDGPTASASTFVV